MKVKANSKFSIPFTSLKEGMHNFEFEIEKEFFDNFEFSEIDNGHLKASLLLNKQENLMTLNFTIKGEVYMPCDICLDPLKIDIMSENMLIIKFGDSYIEETDDIIVIPYSSGAYNCAQLLYEFIYLALPMRRAHEDFSDECNPQMLNYLKNMEPKENSKNETWDILKSLKNNTK